MARDPKFGGSHSTSTYPADKFIPVGIMKIDLGPVGRRGAKKTHRKRSRAWSRKLAEIGH